MGLPIISKRSKKRDQVLAIDMGGRITKAVHIQRKGDRLYLAGFAIVDTPPCDKAISAESFAELLKTTGKSMGGGRPRQLTLAVGVVDSVFRQVQAPLMPVADLRQMLKLNSKNYLQEDLPNYVFDCFFAPPRVNGSSSESSKSGGGTAKQKVMVGGIKRDVLDTLHTGIKNAGLIADRVLPGIIGPTNAFELAEPELFATEAVALVDIGFKSTIITILDQGDIALNRVIGIGGDQLTNQLALAMKITYGEAESIKLGMASEVQAELEPVIQPLSHELRASLDFFEHQYDKTIGQMFVSGGTARSDVVLQALQSELMLPCKTWNPAKNFQLALPAEKQDELEQVTPQLTVAIGAAASAL